MNEQILANGGSMPEQSTVTIEELDPDSDELADLKVSDIL